MSDEHAEVALLERVLVVEVVRVDVGVELLEHLGGDVVVERRGRVGQEQAGARRGGPHDHEELVVDVEQAEDRARAAQFPQLGLGGAPGWSTRRGCIGEHRHLPSSRTTATPKPSGRSAAWFFACARCAPMSGNASPRSVPLTSGPDPARRRLAAAVCQPWCVSRPRCAYWALGLIGGSVLRAARGRRPRGLRIQPLGRRRGGRPVRRVRRHRRASTRCSSARRPSRRADRARGADARACRSCSSTSGHSAPELSADRRHQRQGRGPATRSRAHGLLDRFVGGHPMAGTAHSGWAAGDGGCSSARRG